MFAGKARGKRSSLICGRVTDGENPFYNVAAVRFELRQVRVGRRVDDPHRSERGGQVEGGLREY